MSSSQPTWVAFASDLLKTLIAPMLMILVGLGTFIGEAVTWHDQGFAMMGIGLAATGAGLGSDLLKRMS